MKFKLNKNILVFLLVLLVVVTVVSFVLTYHELKVSLESERTAYVDELAAQQDKMIKSIQDKNSLLVNTYADLLELQKPETFLAVQQLFKRTEAAGEAFIYMISADGLAYDLKGNRVVVNDKPFLLSLTVDREDISEFKSIGVNDDYWLFGTPIDPMSIDGIQMVAVLRSCPITSFADSLTVTMFDKQACSYIVQEDGSILLRPSDGIIELAYNLLSSIEKMGAKAEDIAWIQETFAAKKTDSKFIDFDNQSWLVAITPIDDINKSPYNQTNTSAYSLLVVPSTLVAAQSYWEMNQLIIALSLVFIALLLFMAYCALLMAQNAKKRREERYALQLREKAAQSKTDFLTRMSHDIRTPLNGIIGMNYIVKSQVDPENTEVIEGLEQISSSADYLLSILNDILNMSKIESGQLEINHKPFAVETLLNTINTLVLPTAAKKDIAFKISMPEEIRYDYIGDALRINQILMNLLSNAVKFTEKGSVTLTVKMAVLNEGKDAWTFVVEDTGIGMTETYMQKLFTPFLQEDEGIAVSYGGSGLGLSIVKNLVDLMGGTVTVQSEKGVGSCFTVVLPLERTEKSEKEVLGEEDTEKDLALLKGKRVLVVEDHPVNASIIKKILEGFGLKVEVAGDGQLGVNAFLDAPEGYFSLVLMDIRMPNMDGYTAVKAIRNSDHPEAKTMPVCAMSANAFDEDVVQSLACGMNEHLKKPVEIDVLKKTILNYIKP